MTFDEMITILKDCQDTTKALEEARQRALKETSGQTQEATLAKIKAATGASYDEAFQAVRLCKAGILGVLKEAHEKLNKTRESDYLNPERQSPDFKLLDLPVKLTTQEVQQLIDRNWNYPLFLRACRDKFKGDQYVGLNFGDPWNRAITNITNTFDAYTRNLEGMRNGINTNRGMLAAYLVSAETTKNHINELIEKIEIATK